MYDDILGIECDQPAPIKSIPALSAIVLPGFKSSIITKSFDSNESFSIICFIGHTAGLNRYYKEILKFSDDEIQYQFNNWIGYVMEHTPSAFNGIREILWKFKENRRTHLCCITFHEQKYN